ncbi:hypothetical protein D3C75_1038570 [compost metagenome]
MEGQGQLADVGEQILTEGVYGFVGRLIHQVSQKPAEKTARPVDDAQNHKDAEYGGEIHLPRSRHGIYGFTDKIRTGQA